eukprot:245057_1
MTTFLALFQTFVCAVLWIHHSSSKAYLMLLDCGTNENVYWGFYNPHNSFTNDTEIEVTPTFCRNICNNNIDCDSWLIDPGNLHTCHFYTFISGPYIYSCASLNDPPTQAGQYYGEIKVCTGNSWDIDANKTIWNVAHESGVGLAYVYNNHNCIILPNEDNGNENGMSVGTIVIIVFLSCFVTYCVVGYTFRGFKTKEWMDLKANVPHYIFWDMLPQWIAAGCKVSFEYVRNNLVKK